MKRFLYYDEDSINSFLAQIEQGLLTQKSNEKEIEKSISSQTNSAENVTGDLSAKVIGIGASLKGNMEYSDSDIEATSKLVKNIQEKVLHDYAFEKVFNYLLSNKQITETPNSIGDIILIKEHPTFLDFDYFQNLFSENGAVRYFNEQSQKQANNTIKALRAQIPKGSQLSPEGKELVKDLKEKIKEIEATINNAEPERKEISKTIEIIRKTIPYNRFIMTNNMIIPFDDNNFRDDPNIIAFKYGGDISMFGFITNIISSENTPPQTNDFAGFYSTLNQVMLGLFKGQEKIYILHPIALYY